MLVFFREDKHGVIHIVLGEVSIIGGLVRFLLFLLVFSGRFVGHVALRALSILSGL